MVPLSLKYRRIAAVRLVEAVATRKRRRRRLEVTFMVSILG